MKKLYFLFFISLFFSCSENKIPTEVIQKIDLAEDLLSKNPDSSISVINNTLRDTVSKQFSERSLIALYLAKEKVFSKQRIPDSVFFYSNLIRVLATSINDSTAMIESVLYVVGDVDGSIKNELEKILPQYVQYAERKNMHFEAAKLSSMYGVILASKGEANTSQPYLLRSYRILDSLGYKKELIPICNAIGANFSEFNNHDQTLFYYKRGVQLAEEIKDSAMLPSLLINIGIDYYSRKMQDSANWFYN